MSADQQLKEIARRNFEKISGSETFCVLFNEKMVDEVIPLIQMGLAIYLDKPIVVLVPKGHRVPMNLRLLAGEHYAEYDPDDSASLQVATETIFRKMQG